MRMIFAIRFRALAAVAIAAMAGALIQGVAGPTSASATALGCNGGAPTRVSGSLSSYPHGYSVNALIGVAFTNTAGVNVLANGQPNVSGGYAWHDWVNPTIPLAGAVNDGGQRTWGSLCISRSIKYVHVEAYPSTNTSAGRRTDPSHFGGAADEYDLVNYPGGVNTITMRLPESITTSAPIVSTDVTGSVNGYAVCRSGCASHTIPAAKLSIYAFPWAGGDRCGIQGFSGGDTVGPSSNVNNGDYFLTRGLAGGQCGSPSQRYQLIAYCRDYYCSPTRATVTKVVAIYIVTGKRIGAAISFP